MGAAGVDVSLLGSLHVVTEDGPVALGPPKQRALLVLLALRSGQLVPVDDLVDGLWGQDPPRSAQKTLQTYVSGLRRVLPPGVLETVPGGYRLQLSPERYDVHRFESQLAAARQHAATGDEGAAAAQLRAALALWRGSALLDVADQPYGAAAAERLEELRRVAVEDLADLRLRAGAHHELVAGLQAAASAEPLRERRWAQLMTALYRCGRQAEALQAFRSLRQLLDDELGIAPSAHLVKLEQDILRQRTELDWAGGPVAAPTVPPVGSEPVGPGSASSALPVPATPLVGRMAELAEVVRALRTPGRRLTTLTGPGGSGKTRLALEVAHQLTGTFGGEVYFVALASVTTAEVMWTALSGALDLPAEGRAPPGLFGHLPTRALVVLDNLEQLEGADAVVGELLTAAPGLVLLATSRRPLRLAQEHDHPVPPLVVPSPDDLRHASDASAVQLFLQQARMVRPGFELTVENTRDVVAVCRGLDGLPLAIELAAARSRLLGPKALLRRLGDALDFRSRAGDRPDRHQTLRQTIAWSHELLDHRRRAFFRRLAVFAGGADLDAVEAVAGDLLTQTDVLELVAELVDASLVSITEAADGEPRVHLLATIRAYAGEQLRSSGDLELTRERHARHYLALVQRLGPEIRSRRRTEVCARLEVDHDNLREALGWAFGRDHDQAEGATASAQVGVQMCAELSQFWHSGGYFAEARTWFELAVRRAPGTDDVALAQCLQALASYLIIAGDLDRADEFARSSAEMCRRLGDTGTLTMALAELGRIQSERDDLAGARPYYEEALALASEPGHRELLLMDLAIVEAIDENFERSLQLNEEALAMAAVSGHTLVSLTAEQNTACTLRLMGRVREAALRMRTLVPGALESFAPDNLSAMVEDFAAIVADLGQHRLAARMLGAATSLRTDAGAASALTQQSEIAEPLAKARAALGPAAWEASFRAGLAVGVPEVLAEACAVQVGP